MRENDPMKQTHSLVPSARKEVLYKAVRLLSVRKLRLVICALLRRPAFWRLLTSASSQRAVVVSERYAEGAAERDEMRRARTSAHTAWGQAGGQLGTHAAAGLAHAACHLDPKLLRDGPVELWCKAINLGGLRDLAQLLRDVLADPSLPATLEPAHRTPTVVSLAEAAYDERQMPRGELDPHRLAVLADALEEAGATGELVAHFRSPGPHVRGCFAVDLCLGLG
jgi:hypothetical protein